MRRTTLRHRLHRLRGYVRAWVCRLRGQHTTTAADYGYGFDGVVDLYCPNCGKIVRRVPLDDFDGLDHLLDTVTKVRSRSAR